MLVNKFEKQPREFYERTSKHLDKPLKRSVLIAILDPDTKLTFVKHKILREYSKMRKELTNVFCDGLDGAPVPMDCNALSPPGADQRGTSTQAQQQQPTQQPTPW